MCFLEKAPSSLCSYTDLAVEWMDGWMGNMYYFSTDHNTLHGQLEHTEVDINVTLYGSQPCVSLN